MTEQELEMFVEEFGKLNKQIDRLLNVERAAKNVLLAFSGTLDYAVWDKALDYLEKAIEEKP